MGFYSNGIYVKDLERAMAGVVGAEALHGKKILITGATGTIGSFLADCLLQYDRQFHGDITLYAAGRNIAKLKKQFEGMESEGLVFLEYDLMKPVTFDVPVDYVIHAAGNSHPAAFNGNPTGTMLGSVVGTARLLDYTLAHGGSRFLYVSSGEVYGKAREDQDAFEENYMGPIDLLSPRSCYPESKRAAENLCASYYHQYGLQTVIVRPCHTYGPGITKEDSRANAQFFRNVLQQEDIVMKSAGAQLRSYCYIADCASAILTVLLRGQPGEAYNSANPAERITIAQLAETIAECAGRKVIFADPDAVDLANRSPIPKQVLDTQKTENLGWKASFSTREGVEHTIQILREQ